MGRKEGGIEVARQRQRGCKRGEELRVGNNLVCKVGDRENEVGWRRGVVYVSDWWKGGKGGSVKSCGE